MKQTYLSEIKNKKCKKFYKNKIVNDSKYKIIEKKHENCLKHLDNKIEISNNSYLLIQNNLEKITALINSLELELRNMKFNDFSYQNSLLDKNFNELVNFENYLNSIN